MWLFSEIGFFSAVENIHDPKTVLVRARFKADIVALSKYGRSLGLKIPPATETPENDYRFRIIIRKTTWADLVGRLAERIDYSNFKNHVHGDPARDRAYMRCWSAMREAQSSEP